MVWSQGPTLLFCMWLCSCLGIICWEDWLFFPPFMSVLFLFLFSSLYLSFDLPLSLPTSYLADLYSVHIFVDLYLLSIVLTFNLSSCDSSIPYGRGNDGICVWPGEGNQPNAETLWKESGITCQLKALIERQRGFRAGVGVKSRIGLSFLKPN